MNEIKYGIICEDLAQRIFIKNVVPQIIEHEKLDNNLAFIPNDTYINNINHFTFKELKKNLPHFCRIGFSSQYKLNFIFICADSDSNDEESIRKRTEELKSIIPKVISNRQNSVLILPVQCIEHWLWYVKEEKNNPSSIKNHTLEKYKNCDAKKNIYGEKKLRLIDREKIINGLIIQINLDWLKTHSHSFNTFYIEFSDFCKQTK